MAEPTETLYPSDRAAYTLMWEIGIGSSATVWEAKVEGHQEHVAVKIVNLEKTQGSLEDIRKEIRIISTCKHPNIITYHTSFIDGQDLWLIMELVEGGSLFDVMRAAFPNGLKDEELIATILKQALAGLVYLHENGHIHRDIKAANLLIDRDGTVRLADFGVSALLADGFLDRKQVRQTFVGTPCWMAPEVMEQTGGYNYKADVWSFGITALEIATGHAPLHGYPPMKVLLMTLQKDPPSLESTTSDKKTKFSSKFKEMVDLCLKKEPRDREKAANLKDRAFFKLAKKNDFIVKQLLAKVPDLRERTANIKAQMDKERINQQAQQIVLREGGKKPLTPLSIGIGSGNSNNNSTSGPRTPKSAPPLTVNSPLGVNSAEKGDNQMFPVASSSTGEFSTTPPVNPQAPTFDWEFPSESDASDETKQPLQVDTSKLQTMSTPGASPLVTTPATSTCVTNVSTPSSAMALLPSAPNAWLSDKMQTPSEDPSSGGSGSGAGGGGGGSNVSVATESGWNTSVATRYHKQTTDAWGTVGVHKKVHKAIDTQTNAVVAWHEVPMKSGTTRKTDVNGEVQVGSSEPSPDRLYQSIEKLMQLDHPNLLIIHNAWETEDVLVYITDFCDGGDLGTFMATSGPLPIQKVQAFTKQLLGVVSYLHEQNIIHRNLDTSEILFNKDKDQLHLSETILWDIKADPRYQMHLKQREQYLAYEQYDEENATLTPKIDVYSLGMLVLEMASGKQPYSECHNPMQLCTRVSKGIRPTCYTNLPEGSLRSFVTACIELNPDDRPTVAELFSHEFVTGN